MKKTTVRASILSVLVGGAAVACGSVDSSVSEDENVGRTSSAIEATEADLAWVTQIMPILLGRRIRGPGELLALGNAANVAGREHVFGVLTSSPEFVERWAGVLLERFRIGREPGNWNHASCYETPVGTSDSAWRTAAFSVRRHPSRTPLASSTETYNMADIVRGAISIDDAYPAYRGYMFTLLQKATSNEPDEGFEQIRQSERDEIFAQTAVNRSTLCMPCHHTGYSTSGQAKSYLLPEGSVRDGGAPVYEGHLYPSSQHAASFATPAGGNRWPFPGWSTACGRLVADPAPGDTTIGPTGLIDWSGTTPSIWKVDAALKTAWTASRNVRLWPAYPTDPNITPLWIAAAFANDIWREVMGHSLTIPNYLSRNAGQFGMLRTLTAAARRTDSDGPTLSLKGVLRSIVFAAEFTRDTTTTSRKLYEPFLTESPPGPPPLGLEDWTAERIHRYSADVLFRSASYALGGTKPTHFPRAASYPTLSQARAQGMGLSPNTRAAASPSLEGMLNWEFTVAKCTPSAGQPDWLGALVRYADARPALTTIDVVNALKYRITNVPTIPTDPEERAAIAAVLGIAEADLGASFASRPRPGGADSVGQALRAVCGTFLKSPEFMLGGEAGVPLASAVEMPVQAGNLDADGEIATESEIEACLDLRLGTLTYSCDPADRALGGSRWLDLLRICPRGRCFFEVIPRIPLFPPICPECAPWSGRMPVRPPQGIDPRDLVTGGGFAVPAIPTDGGIFLAYAPDAQIVEISAPLTLWYAFGQKGTAVKGTVLNEGDAIDIPKGVYVKIVDKDGKVYETPPGGLEEAPNDGTWTFMTTGPKGVIPEPIAPPGPGAPMSGKELESILQQWADAARNNEPGSASLTHVVTAPVGSSTFVDDPAANDRPDTVVIASARGSSVANARVTGVWYDANRRRWGIYNENGVAMPQGASFNVRAMRPSATAFVHKATAATILGHMTYLDHPDLNGKPEASFQVTHVLNALGSPSVTNNHPVGVWYNTGNQRWAIYNEDMVAMPANIAFNVKTGSHAIAIAQSSNVVSGALQIDSPETNGVPSAKLFVTHNWNPPGVATKYHTRAVGTRYDASAGKWSVFNLDGTAMTVDVGFNVHRGY